MLTLAPACPPPAQSQPLSDRALPGEAGVIPRAIKQIFDTIEANNTDSTVKVTFLELYNEELTDLLSSDDARDDTKRLRLLEDRSGVVAQGLEEFIVTSAAEIYAVRWAVGCADSPPRR
jgi:kinesin family protein 11